MDIVFPRPGVKFSTPQHNFICSKSKRIMANAGRRGGKGHCALYKILFEALPLWQERADAKAAGKWNRPGPLVKVGVISPSAKNYADLWDIFTDICPDIPGDAESCPLGYPNKKVISEQYQQRVYLFGSRGISIKFITAANETSLRGNGYDILLIDEVMAFRNLTALLQAAEPMISDMGSHSLLMLTSSPNIDSDWDNKCLDCQKKQNGWERFEYHTWTAWNLPEITEQKKTDLLSHKANDPDFYRREYLAHLFVRHSAAKAKAVFFDSQIEANYLSVAPADLKRGPFAVGCDLAFEGADLLAVVVVHVPSLFVCRIETYPKTDTNDLHDIFASIYKRFQNPKICYDNTHGTAKRFSEFMPKHYQVTPLTVRTKLGSGVKDERLITKHALIQSFDERLTLGRLRYPHPDEFDFRTLPFQDDDHDQEANFLLLYDQMRQFRRKVLKHEKPNGDIEFEYVYIKPKCGDDILDGATFASRILPNAAPPTNAVSMAQAGAKLLQGFR